MENKTIDELLSERRKRVKRYLKMMREMYRESLFLLQPHNASILEAENPSEQQEQDALATQIYPPKTGNISAAFNPEIFTIGTQMGAFHIEAGTRMFRDFVEIMVEDTGNGIKPYLKMIYNAVRDFPGLELYESHMDDYASVRASNIDEIINNFDKNGNSLSVRSEIGEQDHQNTNSEILAGEDLNEFPIKTLEAIATEKVKELNLGQAIKGGNLIPLMQYLMIEANYWAADQAELEDFLMDLAEILVGEWNLTDLTEQFKAAKGEEKLREFLIDLILDEAAVNHRENYPSQVRPMI